MSVPRLDWGGPGLYPWGGAKYERVVTVALLVQEADLAWALAEAVKPYVSTVERNHVFMAIGAGENFSAIRGLFKSVAIKRIALRPDLVQQCTTWLHAYVGHKDEQYLRHLIEEFGSLFDPRSGNGKGRPSANHSRYGFVGPIRDGDA
jgi:hypothetical protein